MGQTILIFFFFFICFLKKHLFLVRGQVSEKDIIIYFDCLLKKYRASLVSIIFGWGGGRYDVGPRNIYFDCL